MSEEERRTLAELLLGQPEIVAWLEEDDASDDKSDERDASRAA